MMATIASKITAWLFGALLFVAPAVHAQAVFDLANATNREIEERVAQNVETANDALEQVEELIAAINPSGDSAAAELARLSPLLAQLEGYAQVAAEYAARVAEILPDRASRMTSLQQAFDMTEIAAARAGNLLAQATQGSGGAARFTGDPTLTYTISSAIPQRDTTETGEVTNLAQSETTNERGVDSPGF